MRETNRNPSINLNFKLRSFHESIQNASCHILQCGRGTCLGFQIFLRRIANTRTCRSRSKDRSIKCITITMFWHSKCLCLKSGPASASISFTPSVSGIVGACPTEMLRTTCKCGLRFQRSRHQCGTVCNFKMSRKEQIKPNSKGCRFPINDFVEPCTLVRIVIQDERQGTSPACSLGPAPCGISVSVAAQSSRPLWPCPFLGPGWLCESQETP